MKLAKLYLFLITYLASMISGAQTPTSTNKDAPKLPPSFVAADQDKDDISQEMRPRR